MSVPIVVELLLRLMVRRGIRRAEVTASRHGQTSVKPRSGRSQAKPAKPMSRLLRCTLGSRSGAFSAAPTCPLPWQLSPKAGHDAGDRLAGPFGARLPGRGGTPVVTARSGTINLRVGRPVTAY
jgi:hypothetical protein